MRTFKSAKKRAKSAFTNKSAQKSTLKSTFGSSEPICLEVVLRLPPFFIIQTSNPFRVKVKNVEYILGFQFRLLCVKKYLAWGHHDESQARPSRFLYDMLRYESMKSAWWLLAVICSHFHTKRNLNNISKLGGFIFHLLLQADVKRAAENKSNPGSLLKMVQLERALTWSQTTGPCCFPIPL